MYIARYLKAFALTGRQVCVRNYPGRCPGLGASALSGRVGQNRACCFWELLGLQGVLLLGTSGSSGRAASALYLSLRPVTVGSGRASGAFGPSARKPLAKLE